QEKALTVWKADHPELLAVHSQVWQNVAVRVDLAYQAFFRRVKAGQAPGYPREKGAGCYHSLTWKQYGNGVRLEGLTLTLSKIGHIKTVVHRQLPATPKTCTVGRAGTKWYATFACEVEDEALKRSAETLGIDVGIDKFAAMSDGEFVENPRF